MSTFQKTRALLKLGNIIGFMTILFNGTFELLRFKLLFEQPGKELYLRELQRQSGLSMRPIQEELKHLQTIGLIKTRKDGNRTYLSANTEHPLFPEIRSLVEKITGVRALLRHALSHSDIRFAFIFGSSLANFKIAA
jgi:hypothetical protein